MRIRNKNFNKKMLLFLKVKNILKLRSRFLLSLLLIAAAISTPLYSANAGVGDWVTDAALKVIYIVVYMLGAIVLWILSFYVMFGAWLVDVMLEPSIYTTVLDINSGPLMVGWTVIRDFANTFFIFILLLIAFSTILRIQKYSVKAFLPKFIIAIFLINFSALIAAVIIDFGQVFMYEIKGWLGAFGGNNGAMGNLTSMIDGLVDDYGLIPGKGGFSIENTTGVVFAVVFAAIMGSVYIMLAGFLLIRLVVLAILIVLSPIAFIGIILPGLNSQVGTWWKKIFEYSLFGPIFIFFVFLASEMSSSLGTYTPSTPNDLAGLSYLVTLIVPYCVSIAMLLAVIPVTKQLGIAGTGALMGGAMGVGKIAMGTYAGAKLAGGLGRKAGGGVVNRSKTLSRGADSLKQGAYGLMGKVPGFKGAALKGKANVEKSRQDKLQKMEVDLGDLKNIDLTILESKANGIKGYGGTTEDKALLLKAAAVQGKLGDLRKNKDGSIYKDVDGKTEMIYEKYLKGAEPALGKKDLDEITNKNLSFATMTNEGRKDVEKYEKTTNSATGNDYTKEEAKEQVMKDKMADMIRDGKAHEVQDLDNATTAKIWHQSQDADQRKSSINRMAKDQRESLSEGYIKNTIGTEFDPSSATYTTDVANAYNTASDEEKEKDLEYRANSVELGKNLEESFTRGGVVIEKDIEKAFEKFGAKDIARMDKKEIAKYGYAANNSQTRALNRSGETEAVKAIRMSKEDRLNTSIKMGSIGGAKVPVNYDKVKSDLEKAKNNLEREIKIGGDPNRIKKLRSTISNIEKNIQPLLEIEKDIENIDNNLRGKTY
jgi:hypothetical protein